MVLYTQQTCPQCKMIKILLNKKKVSFEECYNLEIMSNKNISHTPVLELDSGKLLQGKELFEFINSLD